MHKLKDHISQLSERISIIIYNKWDIFKIFEIKVRYRMKRLPKIKIEKDPSAHFD